MSLPFKMIFGDHDHQDAAFPKRDQIHLIQSRIAAEDRAAQPNIV